MTMDIKFENIGVDSAQSKPANGIKETPANGKTVAGQHEDGDHVTISHDSKQLSKLVSNNQYVDATPEQSQRILELKSLIQSGQYSVDINALADELTKQYFIKTIG